MQIIDDTFGKTLAAASDADIKGGAKMAAMKRAEELGNLIAERAKEKKIAAVVFDRSGYRYHGIIKTVADSARKGGLTF